jgi:hypothetical protein
MDPLPEVLTLIPTLLNEMLVETELATEIRKTKVEHRGELVTELVNLKSLAP